MKWKLGLQGRGYIGGVGDVPQHYDKCFAASKKTVQDYMIRTRTCWNLLCAPDIGVGKHENRIVCMKERRALSKP